MVLIPGAMGLMKQKGRATTAVARVGKSLPRPSRMQASLATVGENEQRSNLRYVNFTPSNNSKNPRMFQGGHHNDV